MRRKEEEAVAKPWEELLGASVRTVKEMVEKITFDPVDIVKIQDGGLWEGGILGMFEVKGVPGELLKGIKGGICLSLCRMWWNVSGCFR